MKILAVSSFILSQSTRVMDGWTKLRQLYCTSMSHTVKIGKVSGVLYTMIRYHKGIHSGGLQGPTFLALLHG